LVLESDGGGSGVQGCLDLALYGGFGDVVDAAEVDRRIAARTARRQALFDRSTPPQIHIVLDEAAIRREIGGAEVMRYQLAAVIDASERSNITIQVLPFTAGAHAGMKGEFVILDFPDPEDPPVAYVEGLMGDLYLESEGELELFHGAWAHVVEEALNVDDSLALLGALAKETPR
jgi:hypothetical protein